MTEPLKKVVWLEIIESLCCTFPEGSSNQEKEMLKKKEKKKKKVKKSDITLQYKEAVKKSMQ